MKTDELGASEKLSVHIKSAVFCRDDRHDAHHGDWRSMGASGSATGHRDWSEDEIQLVEWTKREQGLAKRSPHMANASFSDQSRSTTDMHDDQWSARPSHPVSQPGDWERKRPQPDISLGI